MYYRFLLLVLLLLLYLPVHGEHKAIFKFDSVYHVSGKSYCNKLRVIDMRENKNMLGRLKTGHFNRTADIVSEQPLPDMLAQHFDKMITANDKGNEELLLVLYSLEMEDRPNKEEIGIFHFDGDFFRGKGGQYTFAGRVDSLYEVGDKWDVSKKLIQDAQITIAKLLARFAVMNVDAHGQTSYSEAKALSRRTDKKMSYAIYNATAYKKGIYHTVEQFLNNQPVDTPFLISKFDADNGIEKTVYVRYIDKDGNKSPLVNAGKFFAIYFDKVWYVNAKTYMAEMVNKNGDFYAVFKYLGIPKKTNTAKDAPLGVETSEVRALIGADIVIVPGDTNNGMRYYHSKFEPDYNRFLPLKLHY